VPTFATGFQWYAQGTILRPGRLLLKPYPEELMDAHDVSPVVNSAKYDGPECIQPVSDDDTPRAGQLSLF
jgi:putative SOS response-associated peptidase YedK